jgi:hypothetical protein
VEGKAKYIEDAALVIDGRVAKLEAEYEVVSPNQSAVTNAADRAAIAEAKHCARLIRALGLRPYRGDPYTEAVARWARGETLN